MSRTLPSKDFQRSMEETRTARSHSSKASSKAKLVTARAKVEFAKQAAELERERARLEEQEKIAVATMDRKKMDLEINLKLLKEKEEAALIEAELESEEDESCSDGPSVPSVPSQQKVAEFVINSTTENVLPTVSDTMPQANDFTKFLLKKDILSSRLTPFNDLPESYMSWKSTFRSVIVDIGASPAEEIDLLIKWLGSSSKRHAVALKAAYISNPTEGLLRIWDRLEERFGSAESIYHAIVKKLEAFPRLTVKDSSKLFDLSDILSEVEGLKRDPKYSTTLSYFDAAVGVNPIIRKLPHNLQEKWTTCATNYKRKHQVPFPPFSVFAEFVHNQSVIRNDPSFCFEDAVHQKPAGALHVQNKKEVLVRKTEVGSRCPIHKTEHPLEKCRSFREMSFRDKRNILSDNKLCFRCFSSDHVARECKSSVECSVCSSKLHSTLMHNSDKQPKAQDSLSKKDSTNIVNKCTEVCGDDSGGKSCAKIIPVNIYLADSPENVVKCYAILDEQSNKSLARPELFTLLDIKSDSYQYALRSCSGSVVTSGRRADNCIMESLDQSVRYAMPTLIECADIPNNKHEICTPEIARMHDHLNAISDNISCYDENADILLLIGRDMTEVHHVIDQVTGPPGAPFAQRLGLGWMVIGEMCMGQVHTDDVVNVHKTHVLNDGRTTLFEPCSKVSFSVQDPVFVKTPDDEKVSLSVEDREFLRTMDSQFHKDSDGKWVAPLPFKNPRQSLPNNRAQALSRARALSKNLNRDATKKGHFVEFMDKIFRNGHAEKAPPLKSNEECWYLPIFGVYHPKKPDQIRVVFDSSAVFEGVSLNSVLLQGPDLTNSLLGVLMRFRRDEIAIMADIEQMFFSFGVEESHRNLLRFLWFEDNDPSKQLIEYRMCKHVFGNSPSPAIATYGLRKCVEKSDADVHDFVNRDFYVDDGLSSHTSISAAVDLLRRTQSDLQVDGLRLHKIASNHSEVLKCFPSEDLAKNLKDVDLDDGSLPTQRSLGLGWDISQDSFFFKSESAVQPITKRGILSTINGVFDPLGFLAPFVLEGRFLLREVMSSEVGWDDPVCPSIMSKWMTWRESLKELDCFQIPRMYIEVSLSEMKDVEFHVFSDASTRAIAAVIFVKGSDSNGKTHIGFVIGKSKLAPEKGHTIPRLELCAAVLAVELFQTVSDHLSVDAKNARFYTDSKVVLGYICNQTKRFYTYVSNRVQKITQVTTPAQWRYVTSEQNPADIGSRGSSIARLVDSTWLCGPEFLCQNVDVCKEYFPLLDPEHDREVREISVKATVVSGINPSLSELFSYFSSWLRLLRALSTLRHIALSYHQDLPCKGWHLCSLSKDPAFIKQTELFVLQTVQEEVYSCEISLLKKDENLRRDSVLLPLDPVLGKDSLLRVGGRLQRSHLQDDQKHPIILPGKHPVSRLLVRYYHETVHHQGRHFTEGAVRSAGFWITGGKRLISSVILDCVVCKRLRGRPEHQKMSDLPVERVQQSSPFSHVGVDTFGPWQVVSRRTRGGQAASKRWAVIFTCLTIRAVHIEVLEDLSSSAFTNALRRFVSVRGKVSVYRSDRGTNFVGAIENVQATAINVEDPVVKSFLTKTGSTWLFNSPVSSHMGGVWERMIGVSRRILDAMFLNVKTLTHDVLVTLMAEVSAIINARPIVAVSNDPDCPEILSPSALLTLKLESDQMPLGNLDIKDLYRDQWKQVQYLADQFWVRWRREYLPTLQCRRDWHTERDPLKVGDVVLLKDEDVARNYWPLARISKVFPSKDGRVRKVEVCVVKDNKKVFYTRPIVNLVLMVSS